MNEGNAPRDESTVGGAVRAGLADRPRVEFVTGPVTRVLRAVAAGAPVVGAIVVLFAYRSMPEVVPTHFGFTGEADAWGPRWNVLLMTAIWVALGVGLGILSRFPRVFNYPVQVTESNAARLYREGERLMVWTAFGCSVVFAGALAAMLGVMAAPVLALGLVLLLGAVFVGIIRMTAAA